MLIKTLVFLIDTIGSLYISLVLLRFLFQLVRADYYNPISKAIVKLTNPLLLPLRKIIPGLFGWDIASLLLAFILQILLLMVLWLISGLGIQSFSTYLLVGGLMLFVNLTSIYFFAMLIVVIASWVAPQNYNPAIQLLQQILNPLLRPIQRIIPPVSGLDFSPMVFLLLLYIVRSIVLPELLVILGLG